MDARECSLSEHISGDKLHDALRLWNRGYDTKEIAWRLRATEAAAYNGLHQIRTRERRKVAA